MKPERNAGREWSKWWKDVGRWAANRSARKGRLKCQRCGGVRREGIPESAEILTCEACGWFGTLSDWWKTDLQDEADEMAGHPPAETAIRIEEAAGRSVFRIPASGNGGGLVGFGWLWTGFCGLFMILALTTVGRWEDLWPVAIVGLFVAIGVGMLYFGYRMKNARHRLVIGADRIELTREWRGRSKTRSMRRGEFEGVTRQVFYTRNDDPVYGIEVRGKSGRLRFGAGLSDDEKVWLVSELRSRLKPATAASRPASGDRRRSFAIEIPANSSVVTLWVVLVVMGLAFGGVVVFGMDDTGMGKERDASFPFSIIQGLFGILEPAVKWVFSGAALLMLIGGLVGLGHAWKRRGMKRELVGTAESLLVVDRKRGFVVRKRTFDRGGFRGIRLTNSGHINNRSHVRMRLFVGDQVESLASWVDEEKARAFVEKVEVFLGGGDNSRTGGVDHQGRGS